MLFADDPIAYFGNDGGAMHAISPAEAEPLQQQALCHRLTRLLPGNVPLAALADAQGLSADIALDEAPRLFFPHSIYKSYNPAWLDALDFPRMSRWLQAFTMVDLGLETAPSFTTIDAWLDWLELERGFDVTHSTGTTGRLSLIGRAVSDQTRRHARNRAVFVDLAKAEGWSEDEMWYHIIWPAAAGGRAAIQKMAEGSRIMSARSPDDFIALFDDDLGADYELYVVRARLARSRGQLALPVPSAHVEAKLAEAERRQFNHAAHMDHMLDEIAAKLPGKRVSIMGSPHNVAALAAAGLQRGIGGNFAPGSGHLTVGGLKGREEPPEFEQTMTRFLGSAGKTEAYGATELNTGYIKCPGGRFHIAPWVVAWVLDPTDGWKPKPREGVQEGRGAFLDLAFVSAWGGIVTADHIIIDYRPCNCGRVTPSIGPLIRRVLDRDDDYSWIPAAPGAIDAALGALSAV